MLFEMLLTDQPDDNAQRKVERLQSYHLRRYRLVIWTIALALVMFVLWAAQFRVDEVARAQGEVIASSRVQVLQAVDGGVLAELNVREGDQVEAGQVVARLEQARFDAAVKEIEARIYALRAKATRLRAEVKGDEALVFDPVLEARYSELVEVERALFSQRRKGLEAELRTLSVAVDLARREQQLIEKLARSGDVNQSEVLRNKRALNEAQAKLINRDNAFLEEVRTELTSVEDDLAQNIQILAQRRQQLEDSEFEAPVRGIVKNISVTTVGGVLRPGEELMQIIPVNDELLVEAKVVPADIARVHPGLDVNIRFDPFDYTIYGSVKGRVVYVSADTLKEDSARGEEIYYRVRVAPASIPVKTTTGRAVQILPGMTAQLDIRTGDRTVMDYLLKPIRKTLSESFGER